MDDGDINDFYLILPSNTPAQNGRENFTSHFTVQLAKPIAIKIGEKWEVSLVEINYPYSYKIGIVSDQCVFEYAKDTRVGLKNSIAVADEWRCSKKSGKIDSYESTVGKIVEVLNSNKPSEFNGRFILSSSMDRIRIDLEAGDMIKMNSKLAQLLGFRKERYSYRDTAEHRQERGRVWFTVRAENKVDINLNMYNMFIYCNIVKETMVGDKWVKLLRSIPVNGGIHDIYRTHHFHPARYCPIASNYYDHIEILLTDETGERVKFDWGKVIVHLHVRRRRE